VHPSFKSKEITKIGVMESIISVGMIKEKNDIDIDSLTFETTRSNLKQNTNTILGEKIEKIELKEDSITYEARKELLGITNLYLRYATNKAKQKEVLQNFKISKNIDSLMRRDEVDYIIFNIHQGFKRTKENYTKQSLKGAGVGLLTLGMAVPIYYRVNSFMISMIVDRKKQTLVFINHNAQQIDPLDLNITFNQLCRLYLNIFTFEANNQCYHR
jgi:hypothetical protein